VYVWALGGRVAVYPTDARPGEPALVEFFALARNGSEDFRPGVLFGVPAPRHWCAVAVDGELLVPRGPARSGRFAPVFGHPADGEGRPDAARLPLRPEEILALRPEDLADEPETVHTHRHNRLSGYTVVLAAAWPFLAILARLLPDLPYWGATAVTAPVTAVACVSGWRMFLRPRLSWNGAGLSIIGSIGARLLVWSDVHAVRADRHGAVTVETDHHGAGLVVAARGEHALIGRWLSGHERTGTELAGALRLASERAAARARSRVRDVISLPPAPIPPAAPALLYTVWLVETLAYALLM
jgi:hypothetical protein